MLTRNYLIILLGSGLSISANAEVNEIQPIPISSTVSAEAGISEKKSLNDLLLAQPQRIKNPRTIRTVTQAAIEAPLVPEVPININNINNVSTTQVEPEPEPVPEASLVQYPEAVTTTYVIENEDRVTYPLKINTRDDRLNFLGFIVYAGVGFNWNHIDQNINTGSASKSDSKNTIVPQIGAEYGAAINEKFLVTIGMNYTLRDLKFNDATIYSASSTDLIKSDEISSKLKNRFSFYVAPGYKIQPDWLVYGKVGYHYAKGEYTDKVQLSTGSLDINVGSKSFNGIGYGVGTSYAAGPNLINSVELSQVRYDEYKGAFSTGKVKSTELMVTAKYRF